MQAMPKETHHKEPFSESTRIKLDLYRAYVEAWLQVFLETKYYRDEPLLFFDAFSGPGENLSTHEPGSPLILLQMLEENLKKIRKVGKRIRIYFNDLDNDKIDHLKSLTKRFKFINYGDFEVHFSSISHYDLVNSFIFDGTSYPRLLFLDQFGIKDVPTSLISRLSAVSKLDVLFFFSTATKLRFGDQVLRDLPVGDCRSVFEVSEKIRSGFLSAVAAKEYFLGHFLMKNGPNIYSLFMGTRHPKGVEIFLKEAWKRGDWKNAANFDIEEERRQGDLFASPKLTKCEMVVENVIAKIERGDIKTTSDVVRELYQEGVHPSVVREKILDRLRDMGYIKNKRIALSYDSLTKPITLTR